jgi:dipeptidyl-peptidase 4
MVIDAISGISYGLVNALNGRRLACSLIKYEWTRDRRFLLVTGPTRRTWDSVIEAPYWIYDTRSKKLRVLAEGSDSLRNVHLSPDDRHVGYVRDNDPYITELDSGDTRAVTANGSPNIFNGIFDYGSIMFGFTDAWHWSPDGRKIAFWRLDVTDVKVFYIVDELGKYNQVHPLKYPNTGETHAVNKVGVYDLESRRTVWMDISENPDDYIPLIGWTPSVQVLSIQRLSRDHQRLDLLLADPDTGATRVIITDRDPAWIDITSDFIFLEDKERFIWTSEKDGWRHAYLYDYDGNETQLTDGEWEISSLIAVDEAAGWLWFYAKKDSYIDQHVYRASLDGGEVEKVSREAGWYEWQFSPDRSYVIEQYSNTKKPPVTSLRLASGELFRVLEENEVPGLEKYDVPTLDFIEVETSDGIVLTASMIKPPGLDPDRKYPVIAYGYGNAGSQVVVNRWAGRSGIQRELWHKYMAGQGFIVFSIDNRTTTGRGKAAKNLTYGHYAKWAVHDQLEGVLYLRSLPYVDASRIGFWGWSGRGYLAAALMTKGSPHYKVGVSVAPVIDLWRYQAVGVERWMGS